MTAESDCRVITSNRGYSDPGRRFPLREERPGLRIERVAIPGLGRTSRVKRALDFFFFLLGAAAKSLSGERPDVVVGLSTPPVVGALAVFVARLRKARSAYWVMDVYPDIAIQLGMLRKGGVAAHILTRLSRWTLSHADLVVALDDDMASRLEGNGARSTAVVRNWADGNAIPVVPSEKSRYRRDRGWTGRFVVLYAGNLGLAHEFETILAAAERLREDIRVLFAFVGHGPRLAEVSRAVRERLLTNIECHPPVPRPELGDLLSAGDLHLVTLRPETVGLVVPSKLYGILAAGRPVLYVGPASGEVFVTVCRGCGFAVPNGAVDELARTLVQYLEDPARLLREGGRAREIFEKESASTRQIPKLISAITHSPDKGDRTS